MPRRTRHGPRVDSNTNWLRACDSERACPATLTCVCGQCTRACDDQACPSELVCAEPARWAAAGTCDEPAWPYCGAPCNTGSPCADASQSCVLGLCVPTGLVAPPLSSAGAEVGAELGSGDAPPASSVVGPRAEDASAFDATTAPTPELDSGVPGFLSTGLTDSGAEPVIPVVQWEPPGRALLSVCSGVGRYQSCVKARVPQDASATPQVTRVTLLLRGDGLLFEDSDGTSLSAGPLGSWVRVPDKALTLQLDDFGATLPIGPGVYSGVPDDIGCFEGVGPSSDDPTIFQLCGIP